MEVQLNDVKMREMAGRLRKALGSEHDLSHGKALEALSQVFGHKTWNLFSSMLKREEPNNINFGHTVVMYMRAFSCGNSCSGPDWAKIMVDQSFLDQLLEAQRFCVDKNLEGITVAVGPECWQENERLPLRIVDESLKVGQYNCWFRGVPKHSSSAVETRDMDIEDFLTALTTRVSSAQFLWVNDVLIYDPDGEIEEFVDMLVDAGELADQPLALA